MFILFNTDKRRINTDKKRTKVISNSFSLIGLETRDTAYQIISVSPCAFRYSFVLLKCLFPKKPL